MNNDTSFTVNDILFGPDDNGNSRYDNFSQIHKDACNMQKMFKLTKKELNYRIEEINNSVTELIAKIRTEIQSKADFIELVETMSVSALPLRLDPKKIIKLVLSACPKNFLHINEHEPEKVTTLASSILSSLIDYGDNNTAATSTNDDDANEIEVVSRNRKRVCPSLFPDEGESSRNVRRRIETFADQSQHPVLLSSLNTEVSIYNNDDNDDPIVVNALSTSNNPSTSTADDDANASGTSSDDDANEEPTFLEKLELLLKDFVDVPLIRIRQPTVVLPLPPPQQKPINFDTIPHEEFFKNMINRNTECVICKLDYNFSDFIFLGACSHSTCKHCMSTICSGSSSRCPICRKSIKFGTSINYQGRLIFKHYNTNEIKHLNPRL